MGSTPVSIQPFIISNFVSYFNTILSMKKILLCSMMMVAITAVSQNIEGAWKLVSQNGKALADKEYIKIIQDGYFAFGAKTTDSSKFISAGGGTFSLEGKVYEEVLDFYTVRPEVIGQKTAYHFLLNGNKMTIAADMHGMQLEEVWERISSATDDLTANWVITGRMRDGATSRNTPGARRTIKILSGGRFQWVAFNSETKEFMGTGGGTYTATGGKYIEHIAFFSRDDKRVGASLSFNYEIKEGEWHHSGLSSTGSPIYEIWSKYALAYKPLK
jgi:hypothetical protein